MQAFNDTIATVSLHSKDAGAGFHRPSGRLGERRNCWSALFYKLSFVQMQFAVRPIGGTLVVGYEDNCFGQRFLQLAHQVENLGGALGVQVASRFVRYDQRGVGHDRPGNADALLLTAGKLTWTMPQVDR